MNDATSSNTAPALSAEEVCALRAVAGLMIPASAEYQVPGADDDLIFPEIVSTLGAETDVVRRALQCLEALSGGAFADLAADAKNVAVSEFTAGNPLLSWMLVMVVVRCYYRDDRVMRSLDMEVRPPFPVGFEVEQGDWSLLDPVRARGKIYRDAP